MAETVAIDRPSVTKPVSRPRSRKPATVGGRTVAAMTVLLVLAAVIAAIW